jgi:N-acetylglucosaminyldiphosphoundecaprenol N-acetyl-beta-D-mannosaminyltransferase
VAAADALVRAGRPSFFITANVHYAMLTHQRPELRAVNARAAFLVADGAPLVWASRRAGRRLPERVAGADLIFDLAALAAARGYGVFLLGGAPGVAEAAARRLGAAAPGLRDVGVESPPYREPTPEEHAALVARIRAARPEILMVAATMPRGEIWTAAHLEELGVPLCVNLGAALDFAAGRVRRAPRPLQRLGLEWAFRAALEPRRLLPRYARNARFVLGRLLGEGRRAGGEG